MGRIICLTAAKIDGQTLFKPRVVYLNDENVKVSPLGKSGRFTRVVETKENIQTVYWVYERAMQIEAQRNPSSSDIIVKQQIALGLTGAGTTQGAGTALPAYFNETTTIGAGATEAFVLPAATVNKVVVVLNNDAANDAAKVFPASGEFINAQAVNTVYSIAGRGRIHFVCPTTAGKWVVADDFGK